MATSMPREKPADQHQSENLSHFLSRIRFNFNAVERSGNKSTPAPLDSIGGSKPLQPRINASTPSSTVSRSPAGFTWDEKKPTLGIAAVNTSDPTASPRLGQRNPSCTDKAFQVSAPTKRASSSGQQGDKSPRHDLPVYALSQTLRASSIGATMALSPPDGLSGLGWSRYAPGDQKGRPRTDLNQRTAETIARQADIDARLAKLRLRRDMLTEQHDAARRHEATVHQKATAELHAHKSGGQTHAENGVNRPVAVCIREEEEKKDATRLRYEQAERDSLRSERERAEQERENAERAQREKEAVEEESLCTSLLGQIDKVEKDALNRTKAKMMEAQKCMEQSTAEQGQLTSSIEAKSDDIDETQDKLQSLQEELRALQDAKAAAAALVKTSTDTYVMEKMRSERIVEYARITREKVQDRSVKSHVMLEPFKAQIKVELVGEVAGTRDTEAMVEQGSASVHGSAKSETDNSKADTAPRGPTESVCSSDETSCPRKTSAGTPKEDQLMFDEWPSQQARPFGGAQQRLVKLSSLPSTSTIASIQALVWGGRIEKFDYTPGNTYAWVLFMRGQDCNVYFKDTANGIKLPDGSGTVWVEMGEPMSVNETLRGYYDAGHTRCVRAVGADEDWGQTALAKLASAKNRKLERIVNGANPKGLRVIEFRFTNIVDAGRFKVELQNDIDWEHCNIYFGTDPCESSTGVHEGIL